MTTESLKKYTARLNNSWPVIGTLLKRNAAKKIAEMVLTNEKDSFGVLANALKNIEDLRARDILKSVIKQLSMQESIDEICNILINSENLSLRDIVLSVGYAPSEVSKRALFYFLTDQLNKYESLDFDQSLLKSSFNKSEKQLRKRILAKLRSDRRADWTRIVTQHPNKETFVGLSKEECDTLISIFKESRSYGELWSLMFETSPELSADIVDYLKHEQYSPLDEKDKYYFEQLCKFLPDNDMRFPFFLAISKEPTPVFSFQGSFPVFSPTGKMLSTGGQYRNKEMYNEREILMLWDCIKGSLKYSLAGNDRSIIEPLSFTNNEKRMSALSTSTYWQVQGSMLKLFEIGENTLQDITPLPKEHFFFGNDIIAFSPDLKIIAKKSGNYNTQSIELVDIDNLGYSKALDTNNGHVYELQFSPDGKKIAAIVGHRAIKYEIRLYYVENGKCFSIHEINKNLFIKNISFSYDSQILTTVGNYSNNQSHKFQLRNTENGNCFEEIDIENNSLLSFSPYCDILLKAKSKEQIWSIELWSVRNRSLVNQFENSGPSHSFSPDGKTIAIVRQNKVQLYDLKKKKIISEIDNFNWNKGKKKPLLSGPNQIKFSPDGKKLAIGTGFEVQLWNIAEELALHEMSLEDLELASIFANSSVCQNIAFSWKFLSILLKYRFKNEIVL